jgi:hypothetical protein
MAGNVCILAAVVSTTSMMHQFSVSHKFLPLFFFRQPEDENCVI